MSTETKLRWVRSVENRWVAGVASGMAKQMTLDPWLVRLLWALAAFCTFGLAVGFYIAAAFAFPTEDKATIPVEKMLLGVCSRIHARGDMEVGLARLCAIALTLFTGGAAIVGYIVLYFILVEPTKARS